MSDPKKDAVDTGMIRFSALTPSPNGKLYSKWTLTGTQQVDTVKLLIPPGHSIPIVFVPGIMGSNLCNDKNDPVWLLNSTGNIPTALLRAWVGKSAAVRQKVLHPDRTQVYKFGRVPKKNAGSGIDVGTYIRRGWGEVSEASYHKFLIWLDEKMNAQRNPLDWTDFRHESSSEFSAEKTKGSEKLASGIVMSMNGMPTLAENGFPVEPITSDELLKRSKFSFPVYAFGYNWLRSNEEGAKLLQARIEKIISENNKGHISCEQVMVVTHSMGGLVARACAQLPGMKEKILGIVHGVMPAVGAAVAYRRCKVGMADEDYIAGLVIGSTGKEISAVFAQSPGALQLLPSEEYGIRWLEIEDSSGRYNQSLPQSDPYEEIYLERNKWWGLINEDWLNPVDGEPIEWGMYVVNIKMTRGFHRKISGFFHPNTFVFYGGGNDKKSFLKIKWIIKKGLPPHSKFGPSPTLSQVSGMRHGSVRTDGSNNVYVGGESTSNTTTRGDSSVYTSKETSFWEMRCAPHDSAGDGTVPLRSGGFPREAGARNILQQFELPGVSHEPAYRDHPIAQQVTYYSLTKLAALARI